MKPLTEILPNTSRALADPRFHAEREGQQQRGRADVDMPTEVAKVFATFSRFFGARWERTATDAKAPAVWQRALELAHMTPAQIRHALEQSSQLAWPPTTGEFIALGKFDEPSDADAFREAARWACGRKPADENWSHPAVATAAAKLGARKLRLDGEAEARRAFLAEYRECINAHRRGRLQPRAPMFALESPERSRPHITPEERKRVKSTHIAELARFFGRSEEPA